MTLLFIYFYFLEKIKLDISYEFLIHMKCQVLFSLNNNNNNKRMPFATMLQGYVELVENQQPNILLKL